MRKFAIALSALAIGLASVACQDVEAPTPAAEVEEPASDHDDEIRRFTRALAPRLDRSPAGLQMVRLPGGGEAVHLDGRFQSVTMARIGADGTLETGCVDTVEDADAFLRGGR